MYMYPSILNKLLTEYGFANTARHATSLPHGLTCGQGVLIAVIVLRMGLYFVTFSVFAFTYLWWRKESSFTVETHMNYYTI